ncbi:MAG: hypothetical protein ACRD45_10925 [Bryobacteraceae bacterium]
MKKRTVLASSLMAGVLVFAQCMFAASQQSPAAQSQSGTNAAPAHSWTMEEAATSTVRQAWVLGGRNEAGFFQIVKALAELSAHNRGIALPNNKAAGKRAGNWIKKEAKKDPDQLLYCIVDRAVLYTAAHEKNAATQ